VRPAVALAYAMFVYVGIAAGAKGVVLVAQLDDYRVSRAAIGLTFFTSSAGFMVAGATAGWLVHRAGYRAALALGGAVAAAGGLYLATRPPFLALVLAQVVSGYGVGILESVLNAYLAGLPEATTRLNRLHAFFGVGALIGPVLATWLLGFAPWTAIMAVLAALATLLAAGAWATYPATPPPPVDADADADAAVARREPSLLGAALREPGVLLGALLLTIYVGLELGVGNWAFSYLVDGHHRGEVVAGWTVSGYWLGLTLGRFLLSPLATRLGYGATGLMTGCLVGIAVATVLAWVFPVVGLALLGFMLGPVFPTTMAVVPDVTTPRLVPTAIGVINAGSVVGGSALPWAAGTLGQAYGIWTLMPYAVGLAVVQLAVWSQLARKLRR
jgi:fucose permease